MEYADNSCEHSSSDCAVNDVNAVAKQLNAMKHEYEDQMSKTQTMLLKACVNLSIIEKLHRKTFTDEQNRDRGHGKVSAGT